MQAQERRSEAFHSKVIHMNIKFNTHNYQRESEIKNAFGYTKM